MNRRQGLFFVAVLLLIVFFGYPFESTIVPPWRVRVTDGNGLPCLKQSVSASWAHYSFAAHGNGEYRKTDIDGYVEFPKRTMRKNLLQRIFRPIFAQAMTLAHGSVGISAYLYTHQMVGTGVFGLEYQPGKPMPDKIVVERCIEDKDIP